MNNQTTFNPFLQNQSIVKSYFKKPIVLVLAIMHSVCALLSIASAFILGPQLSRFYRNFFSFVGAYDEMSAEDLRIFETFTSEGQLSTFILSSMLPSLIFAALFATAYFIIYFKSKNENPSSTPKAGFTILFVLSVLNLISIAFAVLVIVICAIVAIVAGIMLSQEYYMSSSDSTAVLVIFSIMGVVFLGIAAVMLIYGISHLNYIKSARNSLSSVTLSAKGAGTYGVISLIYGIFTLLNALPLLFFKPLLNMMADIMPIGYSVQFFEMLGDFFIFSGLLSLVSIAVIIIDAVIALGYKNHIKYVTSSYNAPNTEYGFNAPQAPTQGNAGTAPVPYMTAAEPTPAPQPQAEFEPTVSNDNAVNQRIKVCPRCNTPAKDTDVFCNSCGTKL